MSNAAYIAYLQTIPPANADKIHENEATIGALDKAIVAAKAQIEELGQRKADLNELNIQLEANNVLISSLIAYLSSARKY